MLLVRVTCLAGVAAVFALIFSTNGRADSFTQTNLVANTPGIAAHTDPNLINAWGISFSATSPFWVSDQGSGLATLYDGAGNINSLVVSIPGSPTPPSGPTGTVFNGTTGFNLNGSPARFIFDTLNGTIAAWNSGTAATTVATTPGAVYTGLALASSGSANYLYAADSNGHINVFDTNFNNVTATTFAGKFVDPNPIAGYTPFNVQTVGNSLYVTYAQIGARGVAVPGSTGYVDIFDASGNFISRFTTGGPLSAPWGITMAPSGFGSLGGDFLVGNFGNGEINAFTPGGAFVETLMDDQGHPIVDPFLWALDFRTGGANINPNALYLTAGINNQAGGLFAEILPTPEPAPLSLVGFGLLALAALRGRLCMLSRNS